MKKVALLAGLAALFAGDAGAQVFTRPHLDWRTVTTEHFTVHYPAEMAEWTLDVVQRLEPVHTEVAAVVGYAPRERVTILVEDPANATNGSAFPFLGEPVISLWPTPPDPRSNLGHYRDAAEQLVVHEFVHIAHLTRPRRGPGDGLWSSLSPIRVGPVARKAPRWVSEGYATYVEGKLTGYGRPHSAIRAAILRQWALEGRLPTYGQLSQTGGYYGGAFAYLAGSAFLEWLVAQRGEQSLTDLWRRMSARKNRSFAEAFAGVYGGAPHELYGRFTVELTERALAARGALRAGGIAEGDTVQRLAWQTGDPAVSPDGQHLAIVVRGAPGTPSRVSVWRTADEPEDSARAAEAERLLKADSLDVPDIRWRPRPRRPLATLHPVAGRAHDQPRWMPDGSGILLVRSEPAGDGSLRPDLFVWEWRRGDVRRVTHGASLRWPDPAPDGRTAAAVRCLNGICDLVRVDLTSGEVSTVAKGSPRRVFYRPRWAPDGLSMVVSVQEGRGWRLERVDAATGARTPIGPGDGASRYDAEFLPDGRRLVVVSERGGVANLETIDLATEQAAPLTRVTGAATAPEPSPATGHVFYLSLHAGGMDLMRVHPDSAAAGPVVALSPALAPAAPRAPDAIPDTLPRTPPPPSRGYGLGPRGYRILPTGDEGPEGGTGGGMLVSTDPVGRLTWILQGLAGEEARERGAALSAVWRGRRPAVGGEAFWMRHQPSEVGNAVLSASLRDLDADYRGATLFAEHAWAGSTVRQRVRAGASYGQLELDFGGGEGERRLLFAEYAGSASRTRGRQSLGASLFLHASGGETLGEAWRRGVGSLALGLGVGPLNVRGDVTYGQTNDGAPAWERFTAGGNPQPLLDRAVLSQRIARPGARFGVVEGSELLAWQVSTRLAGVTPYYWAATGNPSSEEAWYRVAGAEVDLTTPALNLLRLPGVRFVAGVAYPLDEPFEKELTGYFSVTYRP